MNTTGQGRLSDPVAKAQLGVCRSGALSDADALGSPKARVHQQADDGRVASGVEVLALAYLEQTPELVVGEDRNRFLGELGWLHAVHGVAGQFVQLLHCPGEEGVQPAVAVVRSGRLPALELVGNEGPDVVRVIAVTVRV